MQVCNKCGSNEIQQKEWVSINTGETHEPCSIDNQDLSEFYCPDCEENHLPINKMDFRLISNVTA